MNWRPGSFCGRICRRLASLGTALPLLWRLHVELEWPRCTELGKPDRPWRAHKRADGGQAWVGEAPARSHRWNEGAGGSVHHWWGHIAPCCWPGRGHKGAISEAVAAIGGIDAGYVSKDVDRTGWLTENELVPATAGTYEKELVAGTAAGTYEKEPGAGTAGTYEKELVAGIAAGAYDAAPA